MVIELEWQDFAILLSGVLAHRVGNRMLFGGNLLRQPAFVQLRKDQPEAIRAIGELSGSDEIMSDTLFLGTYPGLIPAMLEAEIAVIGDFCLKQ